MDPSILSNCFVFQIVRTCMWSIYKW